VTDKVCVIGAGSSGIAAAQVLHERGIPFDCFEKGSGVGGNWRYQNDNGVSAAYRSLHINTSRRQMQYASYPMPKHLPHYPSHWDIAQYFDDFVDHFGLRELITFRTEVTSVVPVEGEWEVTAGGVARRYRAVLVANGHHWDARWPSFPGTFDGEVMHAHDYREPDVLVGRRVLVLGIGNSACDIAVESSRVADRTFLAMRRGAHILPKFLRGRPTDEGSTPFLSRLPLAVQRALFTPALRLAQGDPTSYGLPAPDHKLLSAHPTISSELLPRIGHGDIAVKPNIDRYDGPDVVFVDGSRERVDLVVYCTGYRISFPFLDPSVMDPVDNRVALYRRVVHPAYEGLFFIGLLQPLGAVMPLAEAQAHWVADLLQGRSSLPSRAVMEREIERDRVRMAKRFVASPRHTVEVDFHPYLRTLAKERRR
jgi:cation diffusion facilitator CzcD-associated flavoprotein CzcO